MKLHSRWLFAGIVVITAICTVLAILSSTGNAGGHVVFTLLVFVVLHIYFIPSFVALEKSHSCAGRIFLINLLLGWAVLPWVACAIWASRVGKQLE